MLFSNVAMLGLIFAMIVNKKPAATGSKAEPKRMKKEKGQKTARKKNYDAPKLPVGAFVIFMEEFRNSFKLNFPGEKSVGKAGGEKWKSMSETEKSPYLEKASKRKAKYQIVLQEYKKKKQVWDAVSGKKLYTFEGQEAPIYSVYLHRKEHISGPVVRTSGASSSSDNVIAERSEPMPTVVSLSFAEGKLKNSDELLKSTVGKMSENDPSPVRSLLLTGSLLPTMFVNLLVVLLLFSLPVGATEPVQSFASSCSVELEGFSPCFSYAVAAPNYHVDSPTLDCCLAYTAAVASGDDACLCILVRNPQALGISMNKTRMLSLSSLCRTTIASDLKSKCGDGAKVPPTFFIPETAALERSSMETRKGSFLPAFFILLLIGLIRIILVLTFKNGD